MFPYAPPVEKLIPPLTLSEDQQREVADLRLAIETYVDEMKANFIIGNIDVDAEWNNYLAQLEMMGLPRLLEIMQEAYTAQVGKVNTGQIQQEGG